MTAAQSAAVMAADVKTAPLTCTAAPRMSVVRSGAAQRRGLLVRGC